MDITPDRLPGLGAGRHIGILTGGGDAPGMNAALRAATRTILQAGGQPYAIAEGYQGLIDGGDAIRPLAWEDVSNILSRGGTVIGTYRSDAFRQRAGQLTAAANLVARGIDRLIAVGGDGTLAGLDDFASNWASLLDELVATGRLDPAVAADHAGLVCAGLVGSIDNDLVGADLTIGADSALQRIQAAIDAIASTAASHQRCFVVEVMGRHCGYLGLAAAISGGCDYVLIPELPPADGWEQAMSDQLRRARQAGRKDSIVILAEGATTRDGQPIAAEYVRQTIERRLGEQARVTILGHVQRGGTPSAFDRWASTWLGYTAACHVLTATAGTPSPVFSYAGDQIVELGLADAVAATRRVPDLIRAGDYRAAMRARGDEFLDLQRVFADLSDPAAVTAPTGRRIAVMHAGALAPGMNTAAKAAVGMGLARGHTMVGIRDGFVGLAGADLVELSRKDVDGWNQAGGAMLGVRRHVPDVEELYAISRALETERVDALLVIGGWTAYQAVQLIEAERGRYPGLQLPIICLPATIDNNLPGTSQTVGADTALNVIVDCVDKIRMSASASRRCFVIETMGRDCGYLALMGGLAGGAEQVYLNETGMTLDHLRADIEWVKHSFDHQGRTFLLAVRNENANPNYTTAGLAAMLDEEGQGRYDARTMVIGHLQQGGSPTPADRLLATRLADRAISRLTSQLSNGDSDISCVGTTAEGVRLTPLAQAMATVDLVHQRPRQQWWLDLAGILACVDRR